MRGAFLIWASYVRNSTFCRRKKVVTGGHVCLVVDREVVSLSSLCRSDNPTCRGARMGDESKAVGSVPPTALLFLASGARPRRIGGANPLSPTKGEHLRAAITCLAETNPPWPTRLRRSKRRLRHNRERSHLPPLSPNVRSPKALIRHNRRRCSDRLATCPSGREGRKLERQKPFLSQRRYPLTASSWIVSPIFLGRIIRQPCHSFCDARHGMVFSLGVSDALPPLPSPLVCRGTARLFRRPRSQRTGARLCLF